VELTRVSVRSQFRPVDDELGSVVVGLGDPNPDGSAKAVILNHKGYRAGRFASVSLAGTTLTQSYDRVLETLKRHVVPLKALAHALVERQELTGDEVRALLSATMNRPALAKRPTRLHDVTRAAPRDRVADATPTPVRAPRGRPDPGDR
jgi:hypothetical protein